MPKQIQNIYNTEKFLHLIYNSLAKDDKYCKFQDTGKLFYNSEACMLLNKNDKTTFNHFL